MKGKEVSKGALDGIRIIDVGAWMGGTGAGAVLGCLGAEVIKIEDPIRGDSYRGQTRQYGTLLSVKGRHIGFETANLNKKSMKLDLTKEKGRAILYHLVAKSDVLYTNYSEDTVKKLGITYETVKKYNPKLIYGRATGFGSRGPWSGKRAYDPVAQAYSGWMWAMGERDFDEPIGITGAVFDQGAATMMAMGILGALVARNIHGVGQEVHTSLIASGLHSQTMNINISLLRGRAQQRYARKRAPNPKVNWYRCADGKWILMGEPMSFRYWEEFCDATGLAELKDDPRFSAPDNRSKHSAELIQILNEVFSAKNRDDWIKMFEAKNVKFAYSPIYTIDEVVQEPQVIENKYVVDYEHPVLGKIKLAGFPIDYSETPAHIYREAPEHGQHTEEVLIDILGYDWDTITKLKDEGII